MSNQLLAAALSDPPKLFEMSGVFNNLVGVILGLAGFTLFIMLIIGGYKLLTSGGDPKAAQAAQQTITNAIAGIILIACAYLILTFISDFTGVKGILDFQVYHP